MTLSAPAPHAASMSADRVVASGHCPVCAAFGRTVLAAEGRTRCAVHTGRPALLVETTRTGQARLVAPAGARRRVTHPTGLQTPCVSCASAGRDTQGLPRDGDGSDPLCIPCWRTRTDAARRRHAAELRAAALDVVDDVDPVCAACGEPDPSSACWLCGYSWLAEQRARFAADQAAAAAAVEHRFTQLAERTRAEQTVAELTAWVERLRTTIEQCATGGHHERAAHLLADVLAREAAARSSSRGRRSKLALVCGVLAVDQAARITRPGRARTAELAGVTERTVTDCWAKAEALEWMRRTVQGRRLSFEQRCAKGRTYDRAEFDLAHLGGPERAAARAAYLPVALLVLDELLAHALVLLEAAHDDVDAHAARAGELTDHAALARRAQLRAAVATARDSAITGAELIAGAQLGNFFPPRVAPQGEYFSSCLFRGLVQPPKIAHPASGEPSRGEDGASRSPTERGRGAHRVARPRTRQGQCANPRRPQARPEWHGWAYPLAQGIQRALEWLEGVPLPRVAATIGARLGPDWTVQAMLATIDRSRDGRELLTAPDRPLGYLRSLLDEALTGEHELPHPARRREQHVQEVAAARRRDVVDQAAAAAAGLATARAGWSARDDAAAVERAGAGAARRAALAAARAAGRGDHAAARAAAAGVDEWPPVAQPGAGRAPDSDR
ncbi:hypothetical protein O7630_35630 [Micromonospora sp. WMMD718]|uniref:hypothetical protein n=1 Tax=Micromonospora sp. WMMD718 TaxID=3016098 RepID=UPI002415C013|nr:hypothetical protein [Micromonospora sp. WMMD718]MDG4756247.1 hypothetical protein [Micromonospora sp. WMMD718]MDG4756282.1 hypothetical protein [Micromonospora sp. WMMD718]